MSSTIFVVRALGLLFAATALAPFASAQSIGRAKQLFDDAKYAEAKTELLTLQKAKDAAREHYRTALKINLKSLASQQALDALK